jgi:hypothetical protein
MINHLVLQKVSNWGEMLRVRMSRHTRRNSEDEGKAEEEKKILGNRF